MSRRFWSNLLAVAYREALVLRHQPSYLIAVLIQPVLMLFLYGFAISNKPANVPWAVLDRSRTAVSRRFVEEVRTTPYFLPPRAVDSYEAGRKLLGGGDVVALLVVPDTFRRDIERGRPRVQLLLDGSDPLTAARIGAYVGQVAAAFAPQLVAEPPGPALPASADATIDVRQRFWFNPTLRDRDFFLAALAGMLLTNICLSGTGLSLVGERESGTYEQMLALPASAVELVLGKLVPHVVVAYVVLVLAVLGSGVVYGVWPQGSWLTLAVVTLPFVLASLSAGVLVSALASTSAQSVFISVFFILPSFVLSGVLLPYQLMPNGVRQIGGLFPLRWYQIASRRIIERGAGLAEVAEPTLVLLGLFVVLLALIRWRMNPRLG
jgi:ABC-2 type transport system permease protein